MEMISIRGILIGTVVKFAIDFVAGGFLMDSLGLNLFDLDMSDQEIDEATAILMANTKYPTGILITDSLSTIVAGYIAGRIAEEAVYLNAGIVGVLAIAITVFSSGDYPLWLILSSSALTLPAVALGGFIAWLQTEDAG